MTPGLIKIVLHYDTMPGDYPLSNPNDEFCIPEELLRLGLIDRATEGPNFGKQHYQITDKGRAYVEQLCNVGPPTKQIWVYEP